MEPSPIVEPELVTRAQNGDQLAAQEILTLMSSPLSGFIHRLMGPQPIEQAEDILQDVLLKVFRAIPKFDHSRRVRFSTWAFTFARNHCIDLMRKKRIDVRRIDSGEREIPIPDEAAVAPPRAAESSEIGERLSTALQLLSTNHRDVFELYLRGMGQPQIARRLGVAKGTVKSRLCRARAALRRELHDLAPDAPSRTMFADVG